MVSDTYIAHYILYFNFTVPSSPPQSVTVTSTNPASLQISWQAPPVVNQNGPLTGYVIRYTRSGFTINEIVASGLTYIISGLVPFVNYSVRVAAMTINGTGPFSADIMQVSGESGKLIHICICSTLV